MNYSTQNAGLTFPTLEADRQKAFEFARQQITPEKREQVYKNTLAVLLTRNYLGILGIQSNLSESYSWGIITQFSANIADLYIPEVNGRLECRPIDKDESLCLVPEETWFDRIGFVGVQFNEDYTEGTLLGFVREVSKERLPLKKFRSLEDLIDRLSEPPVYSLSRWLQGIIDGGWQILEDSLLPQKALAWNFRSAGMPNRTVPELINIIQTTQDEEERWDAVESLRRQEPDNVHCGTWAIDLGIQIGGYSVSLVVAVLETLEQGRAIFLQVRPGETQSFLPEGLMLVGLDDQDHQLFGVPARSESLRIQYRFSADEGDRFSVKIALGDASLTKSFVA
jgi:Protein of unknown function (DUF1822)